jgi:predicted nucleic acid-binding protein
MIHSTSATSSAVVDASLLVDAVSELGRFVTRLVGVRLHAPVTIDAEVVQALRRRWLLKKLDDEQAHAALALFRRYDIERHSVQPFVDRMWSMRHNVTAYDAGYVALAESLNVPLLTRDRRLAHSSGHAARIEFIA